MVTPKYCKTLQNRGFLFPTQGIYNFEDVALIKRKIII